VYVVAVGHGYELVKTHWGIHLMDERYKCSIEGGVNLVSSSYEFNQVQ